MFKRLPVILVAFALLSVGCSKENRMMLVELFGGSSSEYDVDYDAIEFKDNVETNVDPPEDLSKLKFVNTEGEKVALDDYLGQQHLVLIFTRGFSGSICPFCTTQTSRLIANYKQFEELDAEILLVYPGDSERLGEFIARAKSIDRSQVDQVPFPILLDEQFEAVNFFDIRANQAHPATYVIDKQGNVLLAYVGSAGLDDRPSVQRILETLETAQSGK